MSLTRFLRPHTCRMLGVFDSGTRSVVPLNTSQPPPSPPLRSTSLARSFREVPSLRPCDDELNCPRCDFFRRVLILTACGLFLFTDFYEYRSTSQKPFFAAPTKTFTSTTTTTCARKQASTVSTQHQRTELSSSSWHRTRMDSVRAAWVA